MTERRPTEMMRTDKVLRNVWRNWALAYGAITLPLVAAIFVPRIWIPFICFIAGYALVVRMKQNQEKGALSCPMLMSMASKVLFISSAVMFIIVILCTDWLVPSVIHLQLYNTELPFVTCLVMLPVLVVMSAIFVRMGLKSPICRKCQRRNGYYAGDSIVATLYYRESKYQIGILLLLSLSLGAVEYWYYFARYINYNLSEQDIYFFNLIPLAIYVLSLFFMAGRYRTMHRLYTTVSASTARAAGTTQVRFLTFSGSDLLLRQDQDGLWDTPVHELIARTTSIGDIQARITFQSLTGITDFKLRYCFTNEGFAQGTNVIHMAAFIPDNERDKFRPEDQWFSAYMLDHAMAANAIAPLLANELYRIHTMTMAWKTYDRKGRRLYPIKHYRPSFRFADLSDWEIDYDDMDWLEIASYNEDHLFFRTHRLWQRMTNFFRKKKNSAK